MTLVVYALPVGACAISLADTRQLARPSLFERRRAPPMNALVGRDCGSSTASYVAVLGNGTVLRAPDAISLVRQLQAAGVNEIQITNEYDGDGQLSNQQRVALFEALQRI